MSGIFGETLTFSQENGPEVQLVVFGDEFYARYETQDGYTVVYDTALGLFCYALLLDGRFASSRVPITEKPPPAMERHLKESEDVRRLKFAERFASRTLPDE